MIKNNIILLALMGTLSVSAVLAKPASQLKNEHSVLDFVQESFVQGKAADALYALDEMIDQNIPEALYVKGILLLNGCFMDEPRNAREATIYFSKAAAQNYVPAITALADSYLNGDGSQKNQKEAARLYKMAADKGDGPAQFNLGVLYRDGMGVKRSKKLALKYLKLASKNDALGELKESALMLYDALKIEGMSE
jgi:TPR repeat protein